MGKKLGGKYRKKKRDKKQQTKSSNQCIIGFLKAKITEHENKPQSLRLKECMQKFIQPQTRKLPTKTCFLTSVKELKSKVIKSKIKKHQIRN